ncbi:LuxR C-terminal-related transcriptional regulator [Burkholderia cepacia]
MRGLLRIRRQADIAYAGRHIINAYCPTVFCTMDAVSDFSNNARAVRKSCRQSEGDTARLRALTAVAEALASGEARAIVLSDALRRALDLLSFDDGLVIGMDGYAPVVRASHGEVLPEGARPVDNGVMRVISQSNGQGMVRDTASGRLRIGLAKGEGIEVLVPLRLEGRNIGVVALISRRPVPDPSKEDLGALQAIGVMLGALLHAPTRIAPQPGTCDELTMLTPREQQVFALLPRGLTNAAMADELGIAPGTVKTHVERILQKLKLGDRTQAAVRATECGYGV